MIEHKQNKDGTIHSQVVNNGDHKEPTKKKDECDLDKALENTFPASDPVSVTRPEKHEV